MRHWILAETNYGHVREHGYDVAVLPLGATEPHNLHLPYGTDIFEADQIAYDAEADAQARKAGGGKGKGKKGKKNKKG